ncbi:hypothetical protein [Tropicimonas sp. S265A]|uniref:hypothetical protein n=1 Tax=Tropicimonas sp. S265A TaxID=3415134 RepID=UPI003C7E0471
MKTGFLALALLAITSVAQAACYADYKAKTEQPLRLHYGVLQLSDAACTNRNAAVTEAKARLQASGWTLLNIVSTFGAEGLERRKADAGQYYLRF